MRIRLFATLRHLAGGKHVEVPAEPGETVGAVLNRLVDSCPRLEGEVLSADRGALLPHVQVFVAGRSVRDLEGLATVLTDVSDMAVFPPVAGG
jgi:sulfur-carrier protein